MRRIQIYVIVCAVIIASAFVVWLPRRPLRFDSQEWLSHRSVRTSNSVRNRMVDDLITRVLTPGLSRKDALQLLGQPDSTYKAGENFGMFPLIAETDCYMVYCPFDQDLGIVESTEVLLIEYDKSERLVKSYRDIYST